MLVDVNTTMAKISNSLDSYLAESTSLVLIHVSYFAVANKAFGDNYFNLHFMSKETQNSFQQIFN